MSHPADLLRRLEDAGVELWADGDVLRYRSPKALSQRMIRHLRQHKTELLAHVRSGSSPLPQISLAPAGVPLPLSPFQESLWTLERLVPGHTFSNLTYALRLDGPLNVSALQRALDEVVRRHTALRTTLHEVDGHPVQVVAASAACPFAVEERYGATEREDVLAFLSSIQAAHGEPLPMDRPPLMQVTLLRLTPRRAILVMAVHHLVFDGWSRGVLNRELATLYGDFEAGTAPSLPEPALGYGDFAAWQHRLLESGDLDAQLAYWRRRLGHNRLRELDLGWDRPPTQRARFRTERTSMEIDGTLADRFHATGRRLGCTPMMTLLAAVNVLLGSRSGQTDVRVGALLATRSQPELEGMIGQLVNTAVLRTDLGGDPTFNTVLRRVRDVVLRAAEHQDIPFQRVIEALDHDGRLDRRALFQVMVLYHPAAPPPLSAGNLTVTPLELKDLEGGGVTPTTFDLVFTGRERAEGLSVSLVYKKAFFDAGTVAALLDDLHHVVEHMADAPETRLSQLRQRTRATGRCGSPPG